MFADGFAPGRLDVQPGLAVRDAREALRSLLAKVPQIDDRLRSRARGDAATYPNWPELLGDDLSEWLDALEAASDGEQILVGTSMGGFAGGAAIESLLAVSLVLRGARPHALLCDKVLPACQLCEVANYPRIGHFIEHGPLVDRCSPCFTPAEAMYQGLTIPLHRYSENLAEADRQLARDIARSTDVAEVGDFSFEGLHLGEHALAGALRFFARATIDSEEHGAAVVRRYLEAAVLTALAARTLVRREGFSAAVLNHGIYVPQGLLAEVCRQEGVRVVTWNPAYRKQCFIFSHGDSYHHTMLDEPTSNWDQMEWTSAMEADILQYLASRAHGKDDWIWFHDEPVSDLKALELATGVDLSLPTIGLLTNVMWDAQLHYPANAFPNMLDWIVKSVDYFSRRKDLQLVVRVHPAELRGSVKTRQPVVDELRKHFPTLPSNVTVVGPESQVSTYALTAQCDAVLIYGTKTGIELTSQGIPVIVAGEAWVRNKGITLDAKSEGHYFELLDQLPFASRLDEMQTRRSRMYAYHFFFRKMVPITQAVPAAGNPPYTIELAGIDELRPGASPGLDVVCEGILGGAEFIFPAEVARAASQSIA